MIYLYVKAAHIIFIVTWFAGLFYLVRLFIYTTEAHEKPEPERTILLKQLKIMQNRLWYIITLPSALITLILGLWLAYLTNYWSQPWFILKLCFVFGLYGYHILCGILNKQINNNVFKYSSKQYRIWNEVSTIFLFAIVFIVVLKSTLNWLWGMLALLGLSILLMIGIKLYKKYRNDN